MDYQSTIHRLPAEILADIFVYGADDHYNEHGGDFIRTPPGWINVSYVCRHWRSVALNCSSLWTYLFIISPRWTELLSRSRDSSLKLRAKVRHEDERSLELQFLEHVMSHTGRIQELHLDVRGSEINEHGRLYKIFSQLEHASRLRYLTVYASLTGSCAVLPFRGGAAALHTLRLIRFPLAWYSFRLDLTVLNLAHVSSQSRQSMEDFLTTLRCMQKLQYLHLHTALSDCADFLLTDGPMPRPKSLPKVELASLSRLSIDDSISKVIMLLFYLNIPPMTLISIHLHYEHNFGPYHIILRSLLSRRFPISNAQALSIPVIRSLVITSKANDASFVLATAPLSAHPNLGSPFSHADWDQNIPLRIVQYDLQVVDEERDEVMSSLCLHLPLGNVQFLHSVAPPFSSSFWFPYWNGFEIYDMGRPS